jgi:hypothetical protein
MAAARGNRLGQSVFPSHAASMTAPASSGVGLQLMTDPPPKAGEVDPHTKPGCTHSGELWQSCAMFVWQGASSQLDETTTVPINGVPAQQACPGGHPADDMQLRPAPATHDASVLAQVPSSKHLNQMS